MRKSPIKHHVRSHRRVGVKVHDYDRGHGLNSSVADPNIKHTSPSSKNFIVYINYLDQDAKETLHIPASNYPEAIEQAMTNRKSLSTPTEVEALMN